eukprot:TRINITY_DN4950_c0_g1_i2.p1 TRINITY_DN4950_c0_g1~~TRINITY_DN4950_c0_g1_i2.p1  ORF type:complete len:124 (+),score=49.60 TRINITY_DN4950_c0_g1_i2:80-451(+)
MKVREYTTESQKEIETFLREEMTKVKQEEETENEQQLFLLDNEDTVQSMLDDIKQSIEEKISKRQQEITTEIDKAQQEVKNYFKDREYNRNRKNVFNVITLLEKFRRQIDDESDRIRNSDSYN